MMWNLSVLAENWKGEEVAVVLREMLTQIMAQIIFLGTVWPLRNIEENKYTQIFPLIKNRNSKETDSSSAGQVHCRVNNKLPLILFWSSWIQ
jgi:hypothetical protein